jgi:threonine/homoserine/homoserine lactone efflux protein
MSHLVAFAVVGLLGPMIPGPDLMIVIRNALCGRRLGWATAAGIASGLCVHVTLAAIGISAIVLASATAFTVVKVVGAVYLGYLGLRALMSAIKHGESVTPIGDKSRLGMAKPDRLSSAYRQGLLTNVLNPKVVLFFMSIVPQFVPKGRSFPEWMVAYGALQVVEAFTWFCLVTAAVNVLRKFLSRPKVARGIEGSAGIAFLGFGTRLVLEHR